MKKWIESVLPEAKAVDIEIEEETSSILFSTQKGIYVHCDYYQKHDFLVINYSLTAPYRSCYSPEPQLFSFFTSFWKGYAKEKDYSFVVLNLKSSNNLTQEFLDDSFKQFSAASFYDLTFSSEKTYLVNYFKNDRYWIYEEKKGASKNYLDALNNILYVFEKEKEKNELFSFNPYLESFWINGVTFSFDEKKVTFTFSYVLTDEKVLVNYPHSGKMEHELVKIHELRDFILNLLTKIKNKNRITYLFQPPKKYFYRWLSTLTGFSFNKDEQVIIYQHFLRAFDGDYLQVEIMSKRLVESPDLYTIYPLLDGYILYFSILGKHIVLGFNKKSIHFSSGEEKEMKPTILATIEKISISCFEQGI